MNFLGLLYLLVAHFICGRSVLQFFGVKTKMLHTICLSMIVGVPVLSFVPCILQLLALDINTSSVAFGIAVFAGAFGVPLILRFKKQEFDKLVVPEVYEWPFLVVIFVLMVISVWRCFYYPPLSGDMLSGPELIAEYTVREHTMVNSVYAIDLSMTNNYFKSPYITGLQIMYKLLVCAFGQVWLSVLFVSFTVWMYSLIRAMIHPLLAGFLMLFFVSIPDLYAYTYLVLYDYSNTVLFFCGIYFLYRWRADNGSLFSFSFAAFLFGLATYIRTETLVLITIVLPLLITYCYRLKLQLAKTLLYTGFFVAIPALFYVICIHVFVRNFVPIPFDVGSQINPNLADISGFFNRLYLMWNPLIYSYAGIKEYGYFVFFFVVLLIADLIFIRRFNRQAVIALYGVATVYVGLAFLGYLLPLVDLANTTKRGLFKFLPIMLLYMANSGLLQRLSEWFKKVELSKRIMLKKVNAAPMS